jgi:hypothetical protein
MLIYIYIFIYIYIYIYIYKYAWIYMFTFTYMLESMEGVQHEDLTSKGLIGWWAFEDGGTYKYMYIFIREAHINIHIYMYKGGVYKYTYIYVWSYFQGFDRMVGLRGRRYSMMLFTLKNYNMWVPKIYINTDQPKRHKYKMKSK